MPRCICIGAICFWSGLPGAGKSTLGRQLARRLGKTFIDADAELERKLGVTIATIFEIEGEASFRDREEAIARRARAIDGHRARDRRRRRHRPANRERLKANGTVVYLHAPPETLCERTRTSRHRPLLNTADRAARLASSMRRATRCIAKSRSCVVESDRERDRAVRSPARSRAARRAAAHEPLAERNRRRRARRAQLSDPRRRRDCCAKRERCSRRACRASAWWSSAIRSSPRTGSRRCAQASPRPGSMREALLIPDGEAHKSGHA